MVGSCWSVHYLIINQKKILSQLQARAVSIISWLQRSQVLTTYQHFLFTSSHSLFFLFLACIACNFILDLLLVGFNFFLLNPNANELYKNRKMKSQITHSCTKLVSFLSLILMYYIYSSPKCLIIIGQKQTYGSAFHKRKSEDFCLSLMFLTCFRTYI